MKYWLLKSEPSTYGIDHLKQDGTTAWTGVRNYQARNFMRDGMRPGDRAFFYHSSCAEPGIVGIVEISAAARPDATQFDRKSPQYDPAATRSEPRWVSVDVKFVKKTRTVGLDELRGRRELKDMHVLRRGNRLSVMPVTPEEWECVMRLLQAGSSE
jgi:predicted RNA-binding protein with PUA-like domain